jgi:hypothetical protein
MVHYEKRIAVAIFSGAQCNAAGAQFFRKDDHVRVLEGSSSYAQQFFGKTGKILKHVGFAKFLVELDEGNVLAKIDARLLKKI